MVSFRCRSIVKSELERLGIPHFISSHGAIELSAETTNQQLKRFKQFLLNRGLQQLDDSDSRLMEKIINTIKEVIHHYDELPSIGFKDIINKGFGTANDSVLQIFSDVTGMSIIQFIVLQKIERAKELLLYEDLPLSEITEILQYKNMQLFSAQFKKNTGLTPAFFKKLKYERATMSSAAAEYQPLELAVKNNAKRYEPVMSVRI